MALQVVPVKIYSGTGQSKAKLAAAQKILMQEREQNVQLQLT